LGKTYRVFLNARNILTDFEGSIQKVGFYTTRFVEASSASKAMILATNLVKNDPKVRALLRNEELDPPVFAAQEVEECTERPEENTSTGLVFYLEEGNDQKTPPILNA